MARISLHTPTLPIRVNHYYYITIIIILIIIILIISFIIITIVFIIYIIKCRLKSVPARHIHLPMYYNAE